MAEVAISPPTADDCDAFLAAVARSRSLHANWVAPPATAEDFVHYVAESVTDDRRRFLVRKLDHGELLGAIHLNHIARDCLQSAYVGFFAFEPWAGQGYMQAGLRMVIEHAFEILKLHRLEANLQPTNTASRALVRSCGFKQEGFSPRYLKIAGEWRDHERWAILADDEPSR
jgi:ribosomal-protein-alanine N-acetyltransferase